MVNATVDNEAISISLSDGESTTVPSGEVWKVTVTAGYKKSIGSYPTFSVQINGNGLLGRGGSPGNQTIETVLVGGDTISFYSNDLKKAACHIGGFVVNK